MIEPDCQTHHTRTYGPIHAAYGLTYTKYFVAPRLALQGMPIWWQRLFVWLVHMLPDTPEYTCQRRDSHGHFMREDPWGNYRHGNVRHIQEEELSARIRNAAPHKVIEVPKWTVLKVE